MRDDGSSAWQGPTLHGLLFENAPAALLVVDAQGLVVLANRTARELGIDLTRVARATLEAASETRVIDASGAARTLAVERQRIGAHCVVALRDVTDERKREDELRYLRSVESIGYVTASVVHDLGNLLTPILCLSGLLEAELEAERDRGSNAVEMVRDVRAAAEHAAALVRRVLGLAGRSSARRERVDVGACIEEMRWLLRRVVGETIEVTIAAESTGLEVAVDRQELEHALLNLAANARDAMPRGGRLVVHAASVVLGDEEATALERPPGGAYVALSVTDTGVGMARGVRERVFERFFTTKEKGRGTGLGLPAVQRFVASSGGCVSLRSEPAQGTSIVMYLPRGEAPVAAGGTARGGQGGRSGTETVLVVDDDESVRRAIRAVLEAHGYRVLEASGVESALAELEGAGGADLALVDVVIPPLAAEELVAQLRVAGRRCRVLFMSGHTDRTIEAHGLSVDADPMLRKAFSASELLAKVRAALEEPDDAAQR
jgi:signal transduction histidine kinase/ActR/RegA family two-component response regulator